MSHTGGGVASQTPPGARRDGWAALFWGAFKDSRNAMVLLDEHRRHVDVNGAYLKLAGYTRDEVIGRPVWEFVVGGPRATEREWERALARGELSGQTDLVCADGTTVTVQYAGHTEVATGQRLVLFVVLSTSRWGRHSRRDPQTGTPEALSPREREIVRLVAAGQTGPEIAEHLHISHATVRTHVRNAMAKVGARSRAHLVAKALGDGHALE
jgi:PAS domain S-box-containing protein